MRAECPGQVKLGGGAAPTVSASSQQLVAGVLFVTIDHYGLSPRTLHGSKKITAQLFNLFSPAKLGGPDAYAITMKLLKMNERINKYMIKRGQRRFFRNSTCSSRHHLTTQASTLTQNGTGLVGPVTPRIYWSCNFFTGPTIFSFTLKDKTLHRIHRQHLFISILSSFISKTLGIFLRGNSLIRMPQNIYCLCRTC